MQVFIRLSRFVGVWKNQIGREIRLILLDKQIYHFKKVRLVEVFSTRSDLRVPFTSYGWEHVEISRGTY